MFIYTAATFLCIIFSAVGQQAPMVTVEPRSATVQQGESVSFRCQVQSSSQPVRLEWKRANNQPLADNVKIGPDGSVITITNARLGNQGSYRCVATSEMGKAHSAASLSVTQAPKVRVSPARQVRVRVGEPISLECRFSGRPRPVVTWFRVDHEHETALSSSLLTDSTSVMQVPSASREDAGTYLCRAQSSGGSSESKVEIIIEGGAHGGRPPQASVLPAEIVAVEGQTVTFQCHVSGSPTPTISWSKLRAPLPWLHKAQGATLVLQNVGRQDSGQYICNATNAAGYIEATAEMEVETIPYTTTLPEQLRVRTGETIRLQCLAHGTPPLNIVWFKVGGSLPGRAETRDGILLISQAKAADAGTYKCLVTNKHGSSEAQAKVTVRCPLETKLHTIHTIPAPLTLERSEPA